MARDMEIEGVLSEWVIRESNPLWMSNDLSPGIIILRLATSLYRSSSADSARRRFLSHLARDTELDLPVEARQEVLKNLFSRRRQEGCRTNRFSSVGEKYGVREGEVSPVWKSRGCSWMPQCLAFLSVIASVLERIRESMINPSFSSRRLKRHTQCGSCCL